MQWFSITWLWLLLTLDCLVLDGTFNIWDGSSGTCILPMWSCKSYFWLTCLLLLCLHEHITHVNCFWRFDIRGGSGKGIKWHQGGMRSNKQNSVCDYICCAQFLIENNIVQENKLAGWGYSAGGMLVASAINTSPGMFRAAVLKVFCCKFCWKIIRFLKYVCYFFVEPVRRIWLLGWWLCLGLCYSIRFDWKFISYAVYDGSTYLLLLIVSHSLANMQLYVNGLPSH